MVKAKTVIDIYRLKGPGEKEHYKRITLPRGALTVWKALVNGMMSISGIDIDSLRAQRKRKGGN